jgi:3-methylcrotonyl-CoA carboxylase alpha subunit
MIAKLIVWDTDRAAALRRLAMALSGFRVAGLTTNIDFLYNIATSEPFREARLDTRFIEEHRARLLAQESGDEIQELALAALFLLLRQKQQAERVARGHGDPFSPWHSHSGWRMNEPHLHRLALEYRGRDVDVVAEQAGPQAYVLHYDDHRVAAAGSLDEDKLSADVDGFRQKISLAEHDGSWSAYGAGGAFGFRQRLAELGGEELAAGGGNPRAPMNGVIVTLLAEPGQPVEADAPLLVMEAMKMEHTIRAPAAGVVTAFYYQAGDLVDGDAELLDFKPEA